MSSIHMLYEIYLQHPQISTDSRKITPGSLFFALKGEHFNGNLYAEAALKEGAAYAIVDEPQLLPHPQLVLVPDVLEALQQLATHHRRQFDIPVIAIGGSNGKTTTKELASAVLSSQYPCHFTAGNFNNHIGLPLTLLSMPVNTEVAILEMGANAAGDMAQLCHIAEPTHGLLTNIGKEHLEGFGSLEGVKKAEAELYGYLAGHKGWAFVNTSEKYLKSLSRINQRRIFYGASDALIANDRTIDVRFIGADPFVMAEFLDENEHVVDIRSQLVGNHNFQNIMTAIALGIYFKVPAQKIKSAIEGYQPKNNRSQLLDKGNLRILLDAYNANPSSMLAALQTIESMSAAHKYIILGDMLELGVESPKEHQAILRKAVRIRPDELLLVGKEFGACSNLNKNMRHFPDVSALNAWLQNQHWETGMVLIKGSRGIRLEQAVEFI